MIQPFSIGNYILTFSPTVISYSNIFNHTLTFEDCVTSVLCSSSMDEGGCVIRYGLDSSYQDLGPPVSIPLNTVFTLPNIASSTLYYFTMDVTIGSTSFQLRRTLTTGEGEFNQFLFKDIISNFLNQLIVLLQLTWLS